MTTTTPNHPVEVLDSKDLSISGYTKNKGRAYITLQRRATVSQLMNEQYTIPQISKLLNISLSTVYNDMKVNLAVLNKHRIDETSALQQRMEADYRYYASFCWQRLKEIPKASQGAKWGEEVRKTYNAICELYGLNADKSVNVNHSVKKMTKEKRDAVTEAAINSANSNPKLLPFVGKSNGTND